MNDVRMSRRISLARKAVTLALVAVLTGACSSGTADRSPAGLPTGTLQLTANEAKATLHVEIAHTERERRTGLMHRRHLAADAGMAFVFDRPTKTAFWMRHTFIPLSIAFWDSSSRVVAVYDMDPCTRVRCPVYAAQTPIVGAVEANRGYFKAHGIGVGATVELDR